jgi:hypothetical protein
MEWSVQDSAARVRPHGVVDSEGDGVGLELNLSFLLAQAGLEPGTWVVEKPLKKARLGTHPNGRDLDVRFTGDWDWQAFVDEFGTAGVEVGQTYLNVGDTLGATCVA